jgi:hypothetical protein
MPTSLRTQFASLGTYGGDIIVDIVPDPDEIANAYLRVAEELDNTLVPLEASKGVARRDIKAHFDEEVSPSGFDWLELAEATIDDKKQRGYPLDILRRTGALEDTATSEAAWDVKGDSVFFNTGILPTDKKGRPYWWFHQVGASRSISYTFGGGTAAEETVTEEWDLPIRQWIGLSEGAQHTIIEIFDAWFDESIMTFQRSTGHIQTMKPEGGFGPVVG